MDFFSRIGNWFKGAFGGDDEEKRRKQQQQAKRPQTQSQVQPKQPVQNINQLFGAKKQVTADSPKQPVLFQNTPPGFQITPPQLKIDSPKLSADDQELAKKIPGYGVMQPAAQRQAINRARAEQQVRQTVNAPKTPSQTPQQKAQVAQRVAETKQDIQQGQNPIHQLFGQNPTRPNQSNVQEQMAAIDAARLGIQNDAAKKQADIDLETIKAPTVAEFAKLEPRAQRDYIELLERHRNRQNIRSTEGRAEVNRINKALAEIQDSGTQKIPDIQTAVQQLGKGIGDYVKDSALRRGYEGMRNILGVRDGVQESDVDELNRAYKAGEIDYDSLLRAFRESPQLYNTNVNWRISEDGGIERNTGAAESAGQFLGDVVSGGATAASFMPVGFSSKAPTLLGRFGSRFLQGGAANVGFDLAAETTNQSSNRTTEETLQNAATTFILGGLLEGVSGGRILPDSDVPEVKRRAIDKAKQADPTLSDAEASRVVDEALDNAEKQGMIRREREQQQAQLNKQAKEAEQSYIREAQEVVAREEENFNRYVNEHPELTPQQIEQLRIASADRARELLEDIRQRRADTEQTIVDQANKLDEAVEQQQAVNQEVVEQQQVSNSPRQGEATPEQPASEEVLANDAYAQQYQTTEDVTDELLRLADVDIEGQGTQPSRWQQFFHKATAGGLRDKYKEFVDKARDMVADTLYDAAQSGNIFAEAPGRLATLFNSNTVLKDSTRQIMRIRNDMQSAAGDAVKRLHDNISDKIAAIDAPLELINQRLDQIFETPEFLARKYGEGTPKMTIEQLAPEMQDIVRQLIEANKLRNLMLYRQGRIDIGEYKMFENGMHSPRLYDFEKQNISSKGNKLIDTTSTKQRKNLENISDDTFDKLIESPAQRMLIRLEMAARSNASHDALKALDEAGILVDAAHLPSITKNNQFSQLDGARWGKYKGKFLYNPIKGQLEDSIIMNTKAGQSFSDLVDQYRNSPFGKVDRELKKFKTVYSPGTFLGNVVSNPAFFNRGAGLNSFGQARRMAKSGYDLAMHRTGRTFDPDIYEAQKYGVFASDTGKQITGENNPQLTVANNKKINPFEAAYGGADDAAKLAVWRGLRARGVDPETAARRVSQFTQDYNNAGRLVRTLADMPVLGKPFARFVPELIRLTKNNMLYNPVGMVAGISGIAMIQNELSRLAGESPEEREAREMAMGQTLIPGTAWINKALGGPDRNISLNFPLGDSAVNVARAAGLNFPIDESGDPNMSLIKALTPWATPLRENAQGDMVLAPEELFSSLAMSPIAQQIANRDFMGRQITDPENRTYYEDGSSVVRKFDGEPSNNDQLAGRAAHLAMSYLPLANEVQAVGNAAAGKEDYYGKERSIPEAIARMFGFKTESNTQENRQKRIETKQYFEEDLAAVQSFVKENPDLADAYFKLRNPTRTRTTNTKVSDLITPERWDIINSDTSGRLFNFLKEQAFASHEKSKREQQLDPSKPIRPVDPIYMLPPDQAKYVQELRSRPSGDDIEAQDILRATSNWFGGYEDAYFDYLDKNSAYFDSIEPFEGAAKDNPRVAEYGEASAPVQQPEIIKEYYRIKAEDPERAKEVYKANKEALSAAFDQYAVDRLERINKLRKIEGYEPISLEVYKNKTFGFDVDGGGFSSGGGRGGGRGGSVNTLGELTNYSAGVKRYAPVEAEAMPNLAQLFETLQAARGGGRAKPRLGASSRGQ